MIHSKNRNQSGFTFIEVILAVAMIGICITAIYTLQTSLFTSVVERADAIRRVLYTKNLLYEYVRNLNSDNAGKSETKKVDDPIMQVVLQATPVPEKSKLHQFKYVYLVSGTVSWQRIGASFDQTLVTFALIPPPSKEEKK